MTQIGAQLTYDYATAKGVAGGLYDLSPYEINSRVVESEDGKVKFGLGVVAGTSEAQVKVPASADDFFEGVIVERAHEEEKNGDLIIAQKEGFSVLRYGRVWVRIPAETTVKKGDKLALIASGDDAGKFTVASDDAGATTIAVKGVFIGANDGEIAPVVLYNA